MSPQLMDQIALYSYWFLNVLMLIFALYILLLNAWHTANRHVSLLLLVFAVNNLATGFTLEVVDAAQARWPTYILAAMSPAVQVVVSLAAVVMLKPDWLRGWRKYVWWPAYGLIFVPAVLTLFDVLLGTGLWYTGLDPASYTGGYPLLAQYADGRLAQPIMVLFFYVLSLFPALLALYVLFLDDEVKASTRQLAWMVLAAQSVAVVVQFALRGLATPVVRSLLLSIVLAIVYTYAAFRQMSTERRAQRGRLPVRLTAIVLAITVPLMVSIAIFGYRETRRQLTRSAVEHLAVANRALSASVSLWVSSGPESLDGGLAEAVQDIQTGWMGGIGYAVVVDADDRVVARSDPGFLAGRGDLASYPPIVALRGGRSGAVTFVDQQGVRWQAYVDTSDAGWAVLVQQEESALVESLQRTQPAIWASTIGGLALLAVLASAAIRQSLKPIDALTEAATAISAGDLTHIAEVQSEDEIGLLARTFNNMTGQLRDQIDGLEQRVTDRTRDLERRASYLEASAQVTRAAASVLDPQVLLDRVVLLINEYFGFYHAGIFLLDESREWAVLRAASSEGGKRMLARAHRLRVGEVGIVGYATGSGEPRVALDVGGDAVFFDNPDLPETRSEIALPLRARAEIIGALDVQSRRAEAFSDEDVEVLQILADQVAMALANAQLYQQIQESMEAEQWAYGEVTREAWAEMVRARPQVGYRGDERGILPVGGDGEESPDISLPELELPVRVRGQVIGTINAHKPDGEGDWTVGEIEVLETLVDQLGVALDSARLFQETQRRATRERLAREITDKMRRVADVEEIVRVAVDELFDTLGTSRAFVRLGEAPSAQDNGRDEA